jgi:glutathione S-transferase
VKLALVIGNKNYSSWSMRPWVLMREAKIPFEEVPLKFDESGGGLRVAGIERYSAAGKVPVLLIDGEPLTENVAIQIWIARRFPAARLLPAEPRAEIKAISLMAWCASGIHPHLTPNARPQNYCDLPGSEESVKRAANKLLNEDFTLADGLLAGREWFFEHFTAPDAYFFWCFRRAISFKVDVSGFRNCVAHFERMRERPSVKKVLTYEKQVQDAFARAA